MPFLGDREERNYSLLSHNYKKKGIFNNHTDCLTASIYLILLHHVFPPKPHTHKRTHCKQRPQKYSPVINIGARESTETALKTL